MSKVLIKTMISELGAIIPQDELDKIADKINEVIDLKSKATRSNIDPLAKSERIKSTILQLGNIKEEIIEKLYDHGVEEPDKIRALTMKTMKKIDKAMESIGKNKKKIVEIWFKDKSKLNKAQIETFYKACYEINEYLKKNSKVKILKR